MNESFIQMFCETSSRKCSLPRPFSLTPLHPPEYSRLQLIESLPRLRPGWIPGLPFVVKTQSSHVNPVVSIWLCHSGEVICTVSQPASAACFLRQDLSDSQWRNFREGLALLTPVMATLTLLSQAIRYACGRKKMAERGECLTLYWVVASLAYISYLHGAW